MMTIAVFAVVLAMQAAPQLATGDPLAKDLSAPVHYERLSDGPITLVEADGTPQLPIGYACGVLVAYYEDGHLFLTRRDIGTGEVESNDGR